MLKKIAGIIGGYIVMVAFMIAIYTALYAILGAELTYLPQSYEVSTLWIASTLVLGFFGAVFGGFICKMISKSMLAVYVLAAVLLVFGFVAGIGKAMTETSDLVRSGNVVTAEDTAKTQLPLWVMFLNPVIGAIGIILGGKIRKSD